MLFGLRVGCYGLGFRMQGFRCSFILCYLFWGESREVPAMSRVLALRARVQNPKPYLQPKTPTFLGILFVASICYS